MIRIMLGNVGSGKTLHAVRDMYLNPEIKTYSNIKTSVKNQINIDPSMIIKKEMVSEKKKRDGTLEPVYKLTLNTEFWTGIKESINVTLDECHSLINARRAMSKTNIILSDWIALIRRMLGSSKARAGTLTLITQLERRIDPIAREMANEVIYHVCFYVVRCKKCNVFWQEHSNMPEGKKFKKCPMCGSWNLKETEHKIYVTKFSSFDKFNSWKEEGLGKPYQSYFFTDGHKYMKMYDTLQWDNLFSEYY